MTFVTSLQTPSGALRCGAAADREDANIGLVSGNAHVRRALGALVLLLAVVGNASAQTYTSGSTSYSFIDSSTHTKIGYNTVPYKFNASAGCGTTPPVLDDTLSDLIPIGFTFTYGATNYTTLYVMTNGRVQFGNTTCGAGTASIGPPQTYPYGYPNGSMNNTMKVFGVDLDPTNLVDKPNYPSAANKTPCLSIATCYVSVATIGIAPARQFVVTWKNVPEWVTASNTSGSFDVQVILNEDGTFVYQYGNVVHGGTGTAQIGWQLTSTDYQVLSFGASVEPPPFTAIKFFLPAPIAIYSFDEGAWVPGLAGQVADTSGAGRTGSTLGGAQTSSTGKVCRSANIPLNTAAATVDAVKTGLNISNAALNLLGTGTIAFWYRSNVAWSGVGAQSAQLLDATAVNGQWFFLSKTAAGALVFQITDSTGTVRSVTSPAQGFAANTWVHIAATWNFNGNAGANQDSVQVFINAAAPTVSSFTSAGTVTTQADVLYVGDNALGIADVQGSINSANGLMDEVLVYNYVLTTAQVNTAMNATRVCPTFVIDHLEIQHGSGSGVTCAPSTITIRACQNVSCSTPYTNGLSGSLTATGTPTTNWDGTTGNGVGAAFVIPIGSSSVTKSLQVTTVGSEVLGTSGLSPSVLTSTTCNFGTPSCTFTAADSGFLFNVPNHTADIAQTVTVSAVRKADNSLVCTPAFANVSKPVTFTCSYVNPTTGTLPIRVAGTALNAGNSTAAACDATGAAVNLAFNASGVASTGVQYADVGNVTLAARYAPISGTEAGLVMTGSSTFTARPQGFTLSGIRCTTLSGGGCATGLAAPGNNPGASSAAGAAFIPAGRSFSATVTAVNASGATTPNYGRETSPEGVKLTAVLVLPAGGILPTLTNPTAFGSFSSGVATGTTFGWSEVGIITLTPSVGDGDYLGTGDVTGTTSGNVGRFIPASFALTAGALTTRSSAGCSPASAFTYMNEPLQVAFALRAVDATGVSTTTNYRGAFAKLNLGTPASFGFGASNISPAANLIARVDTSGGTSGTWGNGITSTLVANLAISRATPDSPDGPYTQTRFGIAPVDPDNVQLRPADLNLDADLNGAAERGAISTADTEVRFGRLRIGNALGSPSLGLPVPLSVEYWNGSFFTINTLDSCTRLTNTDIAFGNTQLFAACKTSGTPTGAGNIVFSGGRASNFRLSAPAARGSVDLTVNLAAPGGASTCTGGASAPATTRTASWLQGNWGASSYDRNPTARVSFGQYNNTPDIIYLREQY
jgi:MSHA biogenesis protein MshQ